MAQPDKKTIYVRFLVRLFSMLKGEKVYEFPNWKNQGLLLEVSCCSLWQRVYIIYLWLCGYGYGWAVSWDGRNGGSVLYSSEKGRREKGCKNEVFPAVFLGTVVLAAIAWAGIVFFGEALLRLFGAKETLLPLTKAYLLPIEVVVPVFVFNQMLAAFLRNDNAPGLATAAGIIRMQFNRKNVRYLRTDALSVYRLIVNISMFVQCCAYSVGQASQPILSINYGAENWGWI